MIFLFQFFWGEYSHLKTLHLYKCLYKSRSLKYSNYHASILNIDRLCSEGNGVGACMCISGLTAVQ